VTYGGDRGSAACKRALRRLAREDRPTYRALYEQARPLARTHDQARGRALTLLGYRHPDRYLELYAQERAGPGTDAPPEIRSRAWRKASRRLAAQDPPAYRELFEHAKTGGLTGSRAHDLAITQLRNNHQEQFARLLAAEISRCLRRAHRPLARCPGCGGGSGNNWFDRNVCPAPCSTMHTRCSQCGAVLGDCYWTATRSAKDLLTAHAPVIMAAFRDAIRNRRPPGYCLACDGGRPPCPEHEHDRQQVNQYRRAAEEIQRYIDAAVAHPQPRRTDDHHVHREESHA
jgi:hypothetical protein